jgi:ubiquinone biosynthesis protein
MFFLLPLIEIIAKYNILVVKILQSMSGIDWFPDDIKAFTKQQTNMVYYSDDEIDYKQLLDIISRYKITLDSLTPINSGMVAIVYSGVNREGQRVVIKTKRANIYNRIKTSYDQVACIYNMLSYIAKPFKKLNDIMMNLKSFIESEDYILSQCCFANEIDALRTTREGAKELKYIVIPEVFNEEKDTEFIVMEYLEGKPAFELDDELTKYKYGEQMCRFIWVSVYLTDYLHTDMHPGNVLCMSDNRIGIIDFGMNIRITPELREFMTTMFNMVIEKENNPTKKYDALQYLNTMIEPSIPLDNPNYDKINDIALTLLVNLSNGCLDEKEFNNIVGEFRELSGISHLRMDKFLVKVLMSLSMIQSTIKLFFKDMDTIQKVEKRTLIEAMSTY